MHLAVCHQPICQVSSILQITHISSAYLGPYLLPQKTLQIIYIHVLITLITIAVLLFQSLLHIEAPPTQIFVEIYSNLNVYFSLFYLINQKCA